MQRRKYYSNASARSHMQRKKKLYYTVLLRSAGKICTISMPASVTAQEKTVL